MNAWKSPLLYLGMLVILLAAAALVAPLFISWDAHRRNFEAYGKALVGRDVRIAGDIEARIFPWPVLRLKDVRVANPPGSATADLFSASSIELRMQLAPLLSGHVAIESVEVDQPVFGFERLPSGRWSFAIAPDRRLAGLVDPERVSLSSVLLKRGRVVLADAQRGGSARLEGLEAMVTAATLSGPWKLRGTVLHKEAPLHIELNVAKLRAGEPAKISVAIDPAGSGLSYGFDGEVGRTEGKSLKGRLRVSRKQAVTEPGQKSDAETGWPKFAMQSDVEADGESIDLTKIEVTPNVAAMGNAITGAASIRLGREIVIDARLEAMRLDLDAFGMHGEALNLPVLLTGASDLIRQLPEGLSLGLEFGAAGLTMSGETLEASRFKVVADRGRMRMEEASLALPGQSRLGLSGTLAAGDPEPLLTGEVTLESTDARALADWALVGYRKGLREAWSGSRGRLKLEGKLDAAPASIRLSDVSASLDEAEMTGNLSLQGGARSELALRLVADTLDLDRYAPDGLMPSGDRQERVDRTFDLIAAAMGFESFQLTLQADRVRLHGVDAEDVAVDIGANADGLELRTVQIGNVGEARLDMAGLVRFPDEAVAGSVNASVDAEDPRGLLRLFGILGREEAVEPSWLASLGAVRMKLLAEATSQDDDTKGTMSLTGTAGEADIRIEGSFDGKISEWQAGRINLSGEADSPSSTLAAALLGLRPLRGDDARSRLKLSGTGSLERGVATTFDGEMLGAKTQFAGTLRRMDGKLAVDGRGAVLAEQVGPILQALGLPAGELSPLAGVLSAEGAVSYDGASLGLADLSGTAGGSSFSGDLRLTLDPRPSLGGKLSTGRLSLPWLLASTLMAPGERMEMAGRFRTSLPDAADVDATLGVGRLELVEGLELGDATLRLRLGDGVLSLEADGKGATETPARLQLVAKLAEDGAAVSGSFEDRLDLSRLLHTDQGDPVIEAEAALKLAFTGNGRTPAGLIAAMSAQGEYELPEGTLKRVDPQAFGRDLPQARTPADVDRLLTQSLRSGDVAFIGGKGSLTLANGALTGSQLAVAGKGMTGDMRLVAEVGSGEIDIGLTVALLEPPGLPPFELAYAGPPSALQPSSNTQELKSQLAVKVLQEGIDRLEELQRQEQQLLKEEEQFRLEQQQREENETEAGRKLRQLEARRTLEQEAPPRLEDLQPLPFTEPTPDQRSGIEQTDPQPAPAQEPVLAEPQPEAKTDVPTPRRKPAASRAQAEQRSGPIVLPQSLGPVQTSPRWPRFLFPNSSSDNRNRATVRDPTLR
ncbi:MAG: AsmA family protein [Parvibaculaceae bacterium]